MTIAIADEQIKQARLEEGGRIDAIVRTGADSPAQLVTGDDLPCAGEWWDAGWRRCAPLEVAQGVPEALAVRAERRVVGQYDEYGSRVQQSGGGGQLRGDGRRGGVLRPGLIERDLLDERRRCRPIRPGRSPTTCLPTGSRSRTRRRRGSGGISSARLRRRRLG
jgi:hypothetical protein